MKTPAVTCATAVTQIGRPWASLTAQLPGFGGAAVDCDDRASMKTPALLCNIAGAGSVAAFNRAAALNGAAFALKTGISAQASTDLRGKGDASFKVAPLIRPLAPA